MGAIRRIGLLLASAVIAALVLASSAAASPRFVLNCRYAYGHGPVNDRGVPIGDVSARNMTCSAALIAISAGRLVTGSAGLVTRGYVCRVLSAGHVGGETTGQTIRCANGQRAFRFSWAT